METEDMFITAADEKQPVTKHKGAIENVISTPDFAGTDEGSALVGDRHNPTEEMKISVERTDTQGTDSTITHGIVESEREVPAVATDPIVPFKTVLPDNNPDDAGVDSGLVGDKNNNAVEMKISVEYTDTQRTDSAITHGIFESEREVPAVAVAPIGSLKTVLLDNNPDDDGDGSGLVGDKNNNAVEMKISVEYTDTQGTESTFTNAIVDSEREVPAVAVDPICSHKTLPLPDKNPDDTGECGGPIGDKNNINAEEMKISVEYKGTQGTESTFTHAIVDFERNVPAVTVDPICSHKTLALQDNNPDDTGDGSGLVGDRNRSTKEIKISVEYTNKQGTYSTFTPDFIESERQVPDVADDSICSHETFLPDNTHDDNNCVSHSSPQEKAGIVDIHRTTESTNAEHTMEELELPSESSRSPTESCLVTTRKATADNLDIAAVISKQTVEAENGNNSFTGDETTSTGNSIISISAVFVQANNTTFCTQTEITNGGEKDSDPHVTKTTPTQLRLPFPLAPSIKLNCPDANGFASEGRRWRPRRVKKASSRFSEHQFKSGAIRSHKSGSRDICLTEKVDVENQSFRPHRARRIPVRFVEIDIPQKQERTGRCADKSSLCPRKAVCNKRNQCEDSCVVRTKIRRESTNVLSDPLMSETTKTEPGRASSLLTCEFAPVLLDYSIIGTKKKRLLAELIDSTCGSSINKDGKWIVSQYSCGACFHNFTPAFALVSHVFDDEDCNKTNNDDSCFDRHKAQLFLCTICSTFILTSGISEADLGTNFPKSVQSHLSGHELTPETAPEVFLVFNALDPSYFILNVARCYIHPGETRLAVSVGMIFTRATEFASPEKLDERERQLKLIYHENSDFGSSFSINRFIIAARSLGLEPKCGHCLASSEMCQPGHISNEISPQCLCSVCGLVFAITDYTQPDSDELQVSHLIRSHRDSHIEKDRFARPLIVLNIFKNSITFLCMFKDCERQFDSLKSWGLHLVEHVHSLKNTCRVLNSDEWYGIISSGEHIWDILVKIFFCEDNLARLGVDAIVSPLDSIIIGHETIQMLFATDISELHKKMVYIHDLVYDQRKAAASSPSKSNLIPKKTQSADKSADLHILDLQKEAHSEFQNRMVMASEKSQSPTASHPVDTRLSERKKQISKVLKPSMNFQKNSAFKQKYESNVKCTLRSISVQTTGDKSVNKSGDTRYLMRMLKPQSETSNNDCVIIRTSSGVRDASRKDDHRISHIGSYLKNTGMVPLSKKSRDAKVQMRLVKNADTRETICSDLEEAESVFIDDGESDQLSSPHDSGCASDNETDQLNSQHDSTVVDQHKEQSGMACVGQATDESLIIHSRNVDANPSTYNFQATRSTHSCDASDIHQSEKSPGGVSINIESEGNAKRTSRDRLPVGNVSSDSLQVGDVIVLSAVGPSGKAQPSVSRLSVSSRCSDVFPENSFPQSDKVKQIATTELVSSKSPLTVARKILANSSQTATRLGPEKYLIVLKPTSTGVLKPASTGVKTPSGFKRQQASTQGKTPYAVAGVSRLDLSGNLRSQADHIRKSYHMDTELENKFIALEKLITSLQKHQMSPISIFKCGVCLELTRSAMRLRCHMWVNRNSHCPSWSKSDHAIQLFYCGRCNGYIPTSNMNFNTVILPENISSHLHGHGDFKEDDFASFDLVGPSCVLLQISRNKNVLRINTSIPNGSWPQAAYRTSNPALWEHVFYDMFSCQTCPVCNEKVDGHDPPLLAMTHRMAHLSNNCVEFLSRCVQRRNEIIVISTDCNDPIIRLNLHLTVDTILPTWVFGKIVNPSVTNLLVRPLFVVDPASGCARVFCRVCHSRRGFSSISCWGLHLKYHIDLFPTIIFHSDAVSTFVAELSATENPSWKILEDMLSRVSSHTKSTTRLNFTTSIISIHKLLNMMFSPCSSLLVVAVKDDGLTTGRVPEAVRPLLSKNKDISMTRGTNYKGDAETGSIRGSPENSDALSANECVHQTFVKGDSLLTRRRTELERILVPIQPKSVFRNHEISAGVTPSQLPGRILNSRDPEIPFYLIPLGAPVSLSTISPAGLGGESVVSYSHSLTNQAQQSITYMSSSRSVNSTSRSAAPFAAVEPLPIQTTNLAKPHYVMPSHQADKIPTLASNYVMRFESGIATSSPNEMPAPRYHTTHPIATEHHTRTSTTVPTIPPSAITWESPSSVASTHSVLPVMSTLIERKKSPATGNPIAATASPMPQITESTSATLSHVPLTQFQPTVNPSTIQKSLEQHTVTSSCVPPILTNLINGNERRSTEMMSDSMLSCSTLVTTCAPSSRTLHASGSVLSTSSSSLLNCSKGGINSDAMYHTRMDNLTQKRNETPQDVMVDLPVATTRADVSPSTRDIFTSQQLSTNDDVNSFNTIQESLNLCSEITTHEISPNVDIRDIASESSSPIGIMDQLDNNHRDGNNEQQSTQQPVPCRLFRNMGKWAMPNDSNTTSHYVGVVPEVNPNEMFSMQNSLGQPDTGVSSSLLDVETILLDGGGVAEIISAGDYSFDDPNEELEAENHDNSAEKNSEGLSYMAVRAEENTIDCVSSERLAENSLVAVNLEEMSTQSHGTHSIKDEFTKQYNNVDENSTSNEYHTKCQYDNGSVSVHRDTGDITLIASDYDADNGTCNSRHSCEIAEDSLKREFSYNHNSTHTEPRLVQEDPLFEHTFGTQNVTKESGQTESVTKESGQTESGNQCENLTQRSTGETSSVRILDNGVITQVFCEIEPASDEDSDSGDMCFNIRVDNVPTIPTDMGSMPTSSSAIETRGEHVKSWTTPRESDIKLERDNGSNTPGTISGILDTFCELERTDLENP